MNEKDNKKIKKIKKLIDDGEMDKALEIADANIIESLFDLGTSFLMKGEYTLSEKIFNRIIQLNPKLAEAWSNKGLALGNLEKYDEAIKCFDEALKINPNIYATWMNKAKALVNLEQYADAITSFSKALEINPNDAEAWYNKGTALGKLGKYDEAIKSFDKALKINPDYAEAWYYKGLAFGHLGKHDDAIKSFDEALKIDHNNDGAWLNKGVALVNLGKYAEAIKCYDEALNINPNDDKAWRNKGVALGTLGKHVEAIKSFNEALNINPNDNEPWLNKGVALANIGKHIEAIKCYDQALKINLNYDLAWYNKGVALGELGKYDDAVKCYEETIKINPNYVNSWLNKGVALVNIGKNDEAIKSYDQALKLNPDYYKTWSNKGVALVNLGKHYEAIKCFGEALKINPNYSEAHANLGITLLNINEYDNAANELRKAKELFLNKGLKKDAEKAHKTELVAINALKLISKLKFLDDKFIKSLNSRNLIELKNNSLDISKGIEGIIKEFEEREIPKDVRELLISKIICFTSLSDALQFYEVDLKKLGDAKEVFEKWGFKTFIIAINSLDTFIRELKEYNSIEEIPEEREKIILQVLETSYVLDGKLTEEITDKIKGEPFLAKPAGIIKKPEITDIKIEDTEKDWVRICLVQLDFPLTQKFPYGIKEEIKVKIRSKIFEALEIAKKEMVNITCFPELSFDKEWADKIKHYYKDGIIICGSFYDNNNCNRCQIIIDGKDYYYNKCYASIMEEKNEEGMEPGNRIFIFQTKYGKISVLTCVDFDEELNHIIKKYELDFIINPRCDIDTEYAFQKKADIIIDRPDGSRNHIFILQVNPNKTEWGEYKGGGGTTIIGCEHKYRITKYINDGLRPNDGIKYKIYEVKDEMMLIADLKIGATTERRTKLCNWYLYNGEHWEILKNKGIWL